MVSIAELTSRRGNGEEDSSKEDSSKEDSSKKDCSRSGYALEAGIKHTVGAVPRCRKQGR